MRAIERLALRLIRAIDALCHRLLGWRWNPVHQAGALASLLLLVLIATGLYLLVFYRVGAPWASLQTIQDQWWLGRWIRGVHRLASDLLVVAALVHALRMFAQARAWGPRTLAWISGVALLLFTFVSGWTGFVLVWDQFGGALAVAGARLFDALPILSEPVSRIFAGDRPIPGAFFFVNLFLHIVIPLGMGVGLWLHVSRLARATLVPPRHLAWGVVGALVAVTVLAPIPLIEEYSPFDRPAAVPSDLFYAFWIPAADRLPPLLAWLGATITLVAALLVPRLTRRPRTDSWEPSAVDPDSCTGCNQCPQDCPWEAISMVPRPDNADGRRSPSVARVDPALCVSCGICAGSCPPMGVGPPARTGRAQIRRVRAFVQADLAPHPAAVVAIACENADPSQLATLRSAGARLYPVSCTGNVHSSVIELALRGGAIGVIVLSCPPRDCRGREGPKWLYERLYHDREAELQSRVDRQRVATATIAVGCEAETLRAFSAFRDRVTALGGPARGSLDDIDLACDPVPVAEQTAS